MISLIKEFEGITENTGIKFQPFKYDEIAHPDFDYFETYKDLYFTPEQWSQIIDKVASTKDIWLDMFDSYSVMILKDNLQKIYGIKFQASTLNNFNLMAQLKDIELGGVKILLIFSSFSLDEISEIIKRIEKDLAPSEIILQVGFQAEKYGPTMRSDQSRILPPPHG